ncbi:TetR/AcrR family transcriptional regulator [Nonomuraea rhodomycinica]|uniref:TetR/AcrR family transcriptional regulator n=1 Tax=Nonomuraea rhodomycinica TaxID=1712872 RepID=A0A7Y6IWN2_9ACTN|nr:TetR/AcrR family transcriptional regulator [Nonomuraea rhodomycinica]NUW45441.1 TetR/AcrR family transcriptional regulator [Nonomuraea rhodomycinica]
MSDDRAGMILDAAGELLVAWGYRRVTIEDVARRAGVGKGTVYLHFATKEVLFLTVLMREQARLLDRFLTAFRADPSHALPSELARLAYLSVHEDPIIRLIVTGDAETLGALARTGADHVGPLMKARARTIADYFEIMREHGVVRDDLEPETRLHAFVATLTGFLTVDSYRTDEEIPPAARADALAYIVRSSLETPDARERVVRAVPQAIELYRSLRDLLIEGISRQQLA